MRRTGRSLDDRLRASTVMRSLARSLWLGLALAACAPRPLGAPDVAADPLPPPAATATAPASPASAEGPDAPRADPPAAWQWSDEPDLYPLVDLAIDDVSLSQPQVAASPKPIVLARTGAWQTKVADDGFVSGAAIATDDTRVYVATYSRIASGCELAAFALSDGAKLWAVHAEGIGPIGHSKYSNRVQLRLIDGHPVLFGSESSGRYIEARDAATGAQRSNIKLPGQRLPRPLGEALFYELDTMLVRQPKYDVELADFLRRHGLPVPATEPALRAPFDAATQQLAGRPVAGQQYTLELAVVRQAGQLIVHAKRR